MVTAAVKGRSTMALYSHDRNIHCHRVRFVLAEKGINVDIIDVTNNESAAADLAELNPYNETPTLVDRDLLLHDAGVINDYLDERYPHPPLKPGSPAERAQMRLAVMQLERELFPIYADTKNPRKKKDAVKKLTIYMDSMNSFLGRQKYFISEQYTLADITLAPILWRLSSLGMDTARWNYLEGYMDRLFERSAFERSLSEFEQMLRDY